MRHKVILFNLAHVRPGRAALLPPHRRFHLPVSGSAGEEPHEYAIRRAFAWRINVLYAPAMPKTDPLSRLMKLEAELKAVRGLMLPQAKYDPKADDRFWGKNKSAFRQARKRVFRRLYHGKDQNLS